MSEVTNLSNLPGKKWHPPKKSHPNNPAIPHNMSFLIGTSNFGISWVWGPPRMQSIASWQMKVYTLESGIPKKDKTCTLPETNSSPMKIPIFPCKYHQNWVDFPASYVSFREGNVRHPGGHKEASRTAVISLDRTSSRYRCSERLFSSHWA